MASNRDWVIADGYLEDAVTSLNILAAGLAHEFQLQDGMRQDVEHEHRLQALLQIGVVIDEIAQASNHLRTTRDMLEARGLLD